MEVMFLPIISQFYGILIKMYYNDNEKHHREHIHAQYCEFNGVFDLNGNLIKGSMPNKQKKLIEAWIEIHKEELMRLWKLTQNDGEYFEIEPLK